MNWYCHADAPARGARVWWYGSAGPWGVAHEAAEKIVAIVGRRYFYFPGLVPEE